MKTSELIKEKYPQVLIVESTNDALTRSNIKPIYFVSDWGEMQKIAEEFDLEIQYFVLKPNYSVWVRTNNRATAPFDLTQEIDEVYEYYTKKEWLNLDKANLLTIEDFNDDEHGEAEYYEYLENYNTINQVALSMSDDKVIRTHYGIFDCVVDKVSLILETRNETIAIGMISNHYNFKQNV